MLRRTKPQVLHDLPPRTELALTIESEAAEDQAMGRAHRIGQARPVTVYRLVARGTVEERIVELHRDKRALAEGVLGESEQGAALPSTTELIALMRGKG